MLFNFRLSHDFHVLLADFFVSRAWKADVGSDRQPPPRVGEDRGMRGQSRPSVVQRVYCRVPRHLTQALPRQHSTLAGEESSLAPISLRIFRLGHRGIAVILIIGFLLVTFMVPSTPRIGMGTHRRAPAQLSHLSLKLLLLLWRIATTGCTTTRIFYITTAVQPLEHLDLQLRRTDLVQRILLNVT